MFISHYKLATISFAQVTVDAGLVKTSAGYEGDTNLKNKKKEKKSNID